MSKNHVVLTILDGWGLGPDYPGNAIKQAKTPTMDMLMSTFPHTQLVASGESVGLPKGEDGNTETGHLNIGAGRIVYQDLPRINMSIASGGFFQNKAFLKAVEHVRKNHSHLHLLGLIGQGGVHSVNDHLFALMRFCRDQKLDQVYLHLITDGRDSPPTSASTYIEQVESAIKEIGIGQIATIVGRYFAMDRDHRWERIAVAYEALTDGIGELTSDPLAVIAKRYANKENDEFLKPMIMEGSPRISDHDAVIFYNYRIDRPRELTQALSISADNYVQLPEAFDPYTIKYQASHLAPTTQSAGFVRKHVLTDLLMVTMTEYNKNFPVEVAFPPEFVEMPLSRILALAGRRQLKMSESEKERFVTYYFNGQRELPFPGEDVQITPSPKVATYDLLPEMSGKEQTSKLLAAITSNLYDLIVINYANPDMVAHTGNLEASIKACEHVDGWIRQIYDRVMQQEGWSLLITADHGNVEELINLETGNIDTEHSSFPVPFIIAGREWLNHRVTLSRGILGDVGPTIIKILGINKPSSMTGRSLL
ncbi:MAG: 2,3-bisphosphoglycerate-independent phosphoglycerate mutase [Microgenomates group bacterium GW2011_GWA2_46_7]|nr:MAG: 2,3-bisphosphoglycerate-independent phosphoglycerate mutase [Microgenomates group bacterium GW2011_GWA2_46_7]